jgi:subtilase family serine protease
MKNLTALLIATMLLALATVSAVPLVNPSSTQQPVQLAAVANTQPKLGNFGNFSITTGTYDPNHEMLVTISFFPQHDLQQYLNLVSNPNSPAFHAFLSPTQIASLVGSTAYQQAVSYFQSYGLQVMPSTTGLSLAVQGSADQLAKAFHTSIGAFNLVYHTKGIYNALFGNVSEQSGATPSVPFYAATQPLYLPASIAGSVNGITGLDGAMAAPQIMVPANWFTAKPSNSSLIVSPSSKKISVSSAVNVTNGYFGWFDVCSFFGVCSGNTPDAQVFFPSTIARLVGAQNLWDQGYTGKGITIGIVDVGCIDPNILAQFSQETFGNLSLLDRFTQIAVDQSSLSSCISNGWAWGWTPETALDIEYAATMAPGAHIDLIATPDPQFSSFDLAYQVISSYLSPGSTCSLPSYVTAFDGHGNKISQLPATACPVDITSHSYGAGETTVAYFGSPMYLTVEDQLIESMALEGITNFFAAGDSGSYSTDLESFIPATSPGSTPVGGGQLVAADSSGNPFPNTGVYADFCYNYYGQCITLPINLANASEIYGFTYWSYGFGLTGDYQGLVGGGFGQSISLQQPWWELGNDIYNTGQMIIPVVSGSADFEMTIYTPSCAYSGICPPGWQFGYGGTSFATPIQAGEWALIESKVAATTGLSKDMGDVNPLLFLAHNAQQLTQVNPYLSMTSQPMPNAFASSGAENYFDSYLLSLGYTFPVDRNLPAWYATMNNPQGSGWNYLQGLGMTADLSTLASAISQLAMPQFRIVLSNGNSFTQLTGGNTYSLTVEYANGTAINGHASIVAYSGATYNNSGTTFINGITTKLVALSGGGFSYTPTYTPNAFNAPEYGYFIVNDTTFIMYEVSPPTPTSGTLQVGIDTPYGLVTSGSAQVPMFTMVDASGFYQLGAQGVVLLNGQPVSNAVVTEVAVQVNYSIEDPTFPSQYYGPGVTVGQFITDGRGNFEAWTNGFIAENNGPIPTQVFEVYAQYGALKSQPIYLYVEPQNGVFYASLNNNYQTDRLVGAVSFTSMRYVTNITVYTNDGQKISETFPSGSYSSQSGNATGVFQGVIPINFSLPQPGTPSVVNILATGQNNESFVIGFCFFGFCFSFPVVTAVSQPITWQYSITVPNPGPEPTASVTVPQGVQGGTIKISWQGSWVLNTATAKLQLISQSGNAQTLATQLSGSLSFDTTTVPDGVYSVELTVSTPTGLTVTASQPLVIENTLLNNEKSLQQQVNQLSDLVTQLDSNINQLTNQVTSLQGQVSSLQGQKQQLELQLANVTAQYNAAQSQITSLNSQISQLNSQISSLQGDKQQLQNTITQLQGQIGSDAAHMQALNATIAQLNSLINQHQSTINAQNSQISILVASIVVIAIVAGIAIYLVRKQ